MSKWYALEHGDTPKQDVLYRFTSRPARDAFVATSGTGAARGRVRASVVARSVRVAYWHMTYSAVLWGRDPVTGADTTTVDGSRLSR